MIDCTLKRVDNYFNTLCRIRMESFAKSIHWTFPLDSTNEISLRFITEPIWYGRISENKYNKKRRDQKRERRRLWAFWPTKPFLADFSGDKLVLLPRKLWQWRTYVLCVAVAATFNESLVRANGVQDSMSYGRFVVLSRCFSPFFWNPPDREVILFTIIAEKKWEKVLKWIWMCFKFL